MDSDEMLLLRQETVEASQRLGGDPFLVLHGGGNTSIKNDEYLWAKASGFDLGSLTPGGLVQLRRSNLDELLAQESLGDIAMMNGYAAATVLANQPAPTIEALLHHALPFTSVLHSHADAIVALTDTVHGMGLVAEVFGDEVVPVPYVMPGFELAKLAPKLWRESGGTARAIVLQHHGLVTFGDTVQEALGLHLDLVQRAEQRIASVGIEIRAPFESRVCEVLPNESKQLDALVSEIRTHAGGPITLLCCDDVEIRDFMAKPELDRLTQQGPTTLEHVIRTKRVPLLGYDVAAYVQDYREYFERHATDDLTMLTPVPRVIIHPEAGLLAIGDDSKSAAVIMDIYRHTIRLINAAEKLGGYQTVTEAQAFGLEYWELEQRRLK